MPDADNAEPHVESNEETVARTVLEYDTRAMRPIAAATIFIALLLSEVTYANSFFKGLEGSWKEVSKTTIVEGGRNFTFSDESRVTFRLLKNGILYAVTKGTSDGQFSKSWLYPRGTLRGISYADGVKDRAESTGTWKIRKGKLLVSARIKLDGKIVGRSDAEVRRENRDKYVTKTTASDGSKSTATLTRIRK